MTRRLAIPLFPAMREAYLQGKTLEIIAKEFNVSISTISRAKSGIPRMLKSERMKDRNKDLAKKYLEGNSMEALAKEFSIGTTTVFHVLHSLNVKLRPWPVDRNTRVDGRKCSTCQLVKPNTEFRKNKSYKHGKHYECCSCVATRDLKSKYGLSWGDFYLILKKQNGRCAICKGKDPQHPVNRFVVDHCHKTGFVRGLLCSPCNNGLGCFKDNPAFLKAAIAYLANQTLSTQRLLLQTRSV